MPRIASAVLLAATLAAAMLIGLSAQAAPIDVTSTTGWAEVPYSMAPDFLGDQATGLTESDIVGNNTGQPALFSSFDDNGTSDPGDGYLGYRVRLGRDGPPPGFGHFFAIGLDANADGVIDLFLGVDNLPSGSGQIGIYDPGGTGLPTDNTSPDTTSLVSTALRSWARDDVLLPYSNYDWNPVSGVDPSETIVDLSGDGEDYYLTFVVPFADIVAELAFAGIPFDQNSGVQYVFATSTQAQSLNQDLGGPNGGTKSTSTWAALGAMSQVTSAAAPIPEPATATLVGFGLLVLSLTHKRRPGR